MKCLLEDEVSWHIVGFHLSAVFHTDNAQPIKFAGFVFLHIESYDRNFSYLNEKYEIN